MNSSLGQHPGFFHSHNIDVPQWMLVQHVAWWFQTWARSQMAWMQLVLPLIESESYVSAIALENGVVVRIQ